MRITEQIGSSFEANVPATDGDADFASMDKAEVEQRLVVVCQAAREPAAGVLQATASGVLRWEASR